jgi:hypothetical protein
MPPKAAFLYRKAPLLLQVYTDCIFIVSQTTKERSMPDIVHNSDDRTVLEVTYRFSAFSKNQLDPILQLLEAKTPARRESWELRAGAIDLVTVLEIAVGFVAAVAVKPIVAEYFKGLFNADELKELGQEHRIAAERLASAVRSKLKEIVSNVSAVFDSRPICLNLREPEDAIALVIEYGPCPCYVVLNHARMTEALAADLPDAVIRVMEYLWANGLPDGARCLQLYFDEHDQVWRYLFVPTSRGFGRFIDRYIDLHTRQVHTLTSRSMFVHRFQPSVRDKHKFLIDPYTPERC